MSATNDAGKILLTPKGEFSLTTTYEVYDVVYYMTNSVKGLYCAKRATTGNLPTDTSNWYLLLDLSNVIVNTTIATLTNLGIVKPDGITNETSALGILTALGVVVDAEIDSTATEYGSSWLKVGATTLTPDTRQMYRVTINNKEYLFYWDGVRYTKVSGGGHILVNSSGTEFPERTKLKIIGGSVSDNELNDQTEIVFSGGGGGGSTIVITTSESSLHGQSVTLTDGTVTLTENFSNIGIATFAGVTLTGDLSIESSDGVDTAVGSLTVPYFGNYSKEISFWSASIVVTASSSMLNGLVCYAKKQGQILGYGTFSNGVASMTVPEEGTYSIECTVDWKTYSNSVEVTAQETYNVSLQTFSVTVNLTTPSTEFYNHSIVITVDGQTITGTSFDSSGQAVFTALQVGTYTFTVNYEGESYQTVQAISSQTTYPVEIRMWTATLSIVTSSTELHGQHITIEKDGTIIGTTVFSNEGTATYSVHETGTYIAKVVNSGWTYTDEKIVSTETTYTFTLDTYNAVVNLSTSSEELYNATIIITKGAETVGTTAFSASGVASYTLHEPGTYTFSCTYSGDTYSSDLTISAEGTYSVEINTIITVTVTLYSAASDTVSYTDVKGQQTVVTDRTGKAENVEIALPPDGGNITFTSTVAKNPDNLTADYEKTITFDVSEEDIYVMPDGEVLYWYGYEQTSLAGNIDDIGIEHTYYSQKSYIKNTDFIEITAAGSNQVSAYGFLEKKNTSDGATCNLISQCVVIGAANVNHAIFGLTESSMEYYPSLTNRVKITDTSLTTYSVPLISTENYVAAMVRAGYVCNIYALWLE